MTIAATIVHETTTRIRFRVPARIALDQVRVELELLNGVRHVRPAPAARSLSVVYDGREATRNAVVELMSLLPTTVASTDLPRRVEATMPFGPAALAASAAPLLPRVLRPAVAVMLIVGKAARARRRNVDMAATLLDSMALAGVALTGYPLTAITSVLLGAAAERTRNATLRETDRLLAYLAPPIEGVYSVRTQRPPALASIAELEPADRRGSTRAW